VVKGSLVGNVFLDLDLRDTGKGGLSRSGQGKCWKLGKSINGFFYVFVRDVQTIGLREVAGKDQDMWQTGKRKLLTIILIIRKDNNNGKTRKYYQS